MGLSLGGLQSGSTSAAAITTASGWTSNGTTTSTPLDATIAQAKMLGLDAAGAIGRITLTATPEILIGNPGNSIFIALNLSTGLTRTSGALRINGAIADLQFGSYTDDSANPGNRTVDKARGKNAFAIGAAAVTITNSLVTANSQIICTLEFGDATLTQILRTIPGAGSFVVTGNANATAATKFSWLVIN